MTINLPNLKKEVYYTMVIIDGKIKETYEGKVVYFVVDDLMQGNTPHTNFWTFCLLNDLLQKDPNDDNRFISKIKAVELFWSDEDEYNEFVIDMFENKLKIEIL